MLKGNGARWPPRRPGHKCYRGAGRDASSPRVQGIRLISVTIAPLAQHGGCNTRTTMTRTRKLLLTLAAAASLGSLALAVDTTPSSPSTDGPTPGPRDRIERPMKFAAHHLDLTETQITALKEIFRLHQPELQPLMQRSREERDALRQIVAAGTLDEAALEVQATKIAETTKTLTIATAHLRADLRTILTPEQVDKLLRTRQHMAERRHRSREAFGHWLNEP